MKRFFNYLGASVVVLTLAVAFFAFKSANESQIEQKTILVEIYEVPSYPKSGIHIYYGEGKTEEVLFAAMKKENKGKNGDLVVTTINRLESEGFQITHVGSGLAGSGMITKIFMTKK